MTQDNIIKLSRITKHYRLGKTTVEALRGVTLNVSQGEFTTIVGPSGSGKSTLLNIIGCLDRPSEGSYLLDGDEVTGKDFDTLANLRNYKIGFIFQSFNLIPVLNVIENIEFPCLVRKRPDTKAQLRAKATAIAVDVGLGNVLEHRPDELSGGQRQRVAIARALITDPSLVLADEPTANLDSKTSSQILDLMVAMNKTKGVTFIFATHDAHVMERARRKVMIQDGVIAD
jgi:putative ABC transport system ATP-binding protein